jgi:hypothetical protein
MSKPFEDGTDGIGRGLVAKNIDDNLELEASGRNIFAWEVTNIKDFDLVFKSIPRFLVTNYQMLDDEAEHGDGTMVILGKTFQI